MAARKTAKKPETKPARALSAEERAALREHVRELRREGMARDEEAEVLAKIEAMAPDDRAMARKIHALVKANAPHLSSRLWYGMPAYTKGGNVVCFFQDAQKFKTRYGTLGFSDKAKLDDGGMWPVAFAVGKLTGAEEARMAALIKKAAS